MLVGGVDVAPDDIVVHQPVDNIGALALGRAEHQRVPQEAPFVDEGVGADALHLAKVLPTSTPKCNTGHFRSERAARVPKMAL